MFLKTCRIIYRLHQFRLDRVVPLLRGIALVVANIARLKKIFNSVQNNCFFRGVLVQLVVTTDKSKDGMTLNLSPRQTAGRQNKARMIHHHPSSWERDLT